MHSTASRKVTPKAGPAFEGARLVELDERTREHLAVLRSIREQRQVRRERSRAAVIAAASQPTSWRERLAASQAKAQERWSC